MRFAALFIGALLFLNCAVVPIDPTSYSGQIHVYHENNTYDRTSIYLVEGQSRGRRIISCDGLSKCQTWLKESESTEIMRRGFIELGWRLHTHPEWDNGPDRGLNGRGRLDIWNNEVVVVIKIDPLYTYIFPGERDKEADK